MTKLVHPQNLMNGILMSPADPWVNAEKVPSAVRDYLHRASVAIEHPHDSRRLKLVQFCAPNIT